MKFPFQNMHWVQHRRHNRKFNLKLIYWWNVIRSPTKTNKSTWHWEKDQLVRMKATNITIHRWRKNYTNWSTSAKTEWNALSTTLQSKIKSFRLKCWCVQIFNPFMRRKSWIFADETLPWPNASLSNPSTLPLTPHHPLPPVILKKTPSSKQGTEKREVTLLGYVEGLH